MTGVMSVTFWGGQRDWLFDEFCCVGFVLLLMILFFLLPPAAPARGGQAQRA